MKTWNLYTSKEIKPQGWLRRQLEIQAESLSGNLDKIWPDIRDSAWIGGTAEGWERVPYWLDGFIPLSYLLENEDMIARAKRYIDCIVASQKPDGWLCPCSDEARPTYDTWAVQLITKVLTVYYECSGDERIPNVIYRALRNYYELLQSGTIHLFDWGKFRWYECYIAIDFTYRRTPKDWLLDLARILKEQGANYNDYVDRWKRPLNKWTFETHIVNLGMMLKHEAMVSGLLNTEYTDNAEYLHGILSQYNGTPVGLFTGDECLSGLSPIQGTELCAVVEQMYSYELLYACTGDAKWAERLELLAFNALPATISDDMWAHQYVQMSNQIACQKFPGKSLFRTNNSEAHLFGLEPNYGCCTANFNQGWPKLALSVFMHQGDTVINVLPVASSLKTEDRTIEIESNYPFENTFTYTIEATRPFVFKVRVPSFAEKCTIDGQIFSGAEASFNIAAGEKRVITMSFETTPHFVKRPYELTTVQMGSLVFSVPIAYDKKMIEYETNGVVRKFPYCDYEYIPTSDWSYAYCSSELCAERKEVDATPFSSARPPVVVKAQVQKINWGLADGYETVCAKVPESREPISEAQEIELYPYGCAKLRMTEIPKIA